MTYTEPPWPPSPPSGPPWGTNFSLRKEEAPEPPVPATTWTTARSINIADCGLRIAELSGGSEALYGSTQTYSPRSGRLRDAARARGPCPPYRERSADQARTDSRHLPLQRFPSWRSEERRVGKECRSRW